MNYKYASLMLSTTTAVKDEARMHPAADADVAQACTFRYLLDKVHSWALASELQATGAAYDASSVVRDDDVDSNAYTEHQQDNQQASQKRHHHRMPIVVPSTPPDIRVLHNTAKRLAGLRIVHNLRCQDLLYAAADRLQQHNVSSSDDDDDTA
jgi:hypothetical protein